MKTIVPDYYARFHCLAGDCRHSCCVGWEIDVSRDALDRYEAVPGQLGEKLRENIVQDDCPHFKLTEDERCPFLNEDNLCELILKLGEEALCQICADHPRFRNAFADHVEMGVGLCCEAAASLILERTGKVQLVVLEDDGRPAKEDLFEKYVLTERAKAVAILQDRGLPVEERVQKLIAEDEIRMTGKTWHQWAELFLFFERMDESWTAQLEKLAAMPEGFVPPALPQLETAFEQLLVYFVYRHVPAARDEIDVRACLAFGLLAYRIVRRLCELKEAEGGCTLADLEELARLYSSEIEYSEDNTDQLLNLMWDENDIGLY